MDLGTEHDAGGAPEPAPAGKRPTKEQARLAVVAVLAALATAFALLNLNHVKVNFIVVTRHPPLIVVIVICLAVGFLIGALTARQRFRRHG
jgi:uncharacterized integral membrane protein